MTRRSAAPPGNRAFARRARSSHRGALLNVVDARGKLPRFDDEVRRAAAEMTRAVMPIAMGTRT